MGFDEIICRSEPHAFFYVVFLTKITQNKNRDIFALRVLLKIIAYKTI